MNSQQGQNCGPPFGWPQHVTLQPQRACLQSANLSLRHSLCHLINSQWESKVQHRKNVAFVSYPCWKKSHFNNDSLSLKFFKIKSEYISFLLVLREMLFLQIFLLVILIYTLTLSCLCAVVHLVKKTSNMVLPTLLFWCWEYLKDLNLVVSKKKSVMLMTGSQSFLFICSSHLTPNEITQMRKCEKWCCLFHPYLITHTASVHAHIHTYIHLHSLCITARVEGLPLPYCLLDYHVYSNYGGSIYFLLYRGGRGK